jgi:integrase
LENGDRKHFHSFRHTFKREGRNSGQIAPELLDALQGHAQQGVSANYGRDEEGKQYALPVLQEALEKIDFSDVTQGLESSMML